MGTRKNPETSLEAYRSLDPLQLTEIYLKIIKGLEEINEGTVEEIAAHIKVDKNRVWKRMSELERNDPPFIYKPGRKKPLKSGRGGFTYMLCNPKKTEKKEIETNVFRGQVTASDFAGRILEQSSMFKE